MIPYGLPRGTPLVCIDAGGATSLVKGERYVLDRYVRRDRVVVHREDVSCVGNGSRWYLHRFNVLGLPDGRDYQAPDDCDLQVEAQP